MAEPELENRNKVSCPHAVRKIDVSGDFLPFAVEVSDKYDSR